MDAPTSSLTAHRVKRLGHLDLPGAGQVVVQGHHAFLGHMDAPHGTTILDVSDPARPRVVAEIRIEEDRKSTRLNSSHLVISYAVFCLKKKRLIVLLI